MKFESVPKTADQLQEEGNRKQIAAMIGEGEEDVAQGDKKFEDGRPSNDEEQAQANMATMHTILNSEESMPKAEPSAKVETAKVTEPVAQESKTVENTGEAKKAESAEAIGNKEKSVRETGRERIEKIKEACKSKLESSKGKIKGGMEWLMKKAKSMGISVLEYGVGSVEVGAKKAGETVERGSINAEALADSLRIRKAQLEEAGQAALEKGKHGMTTAEEYAKSVGIRGMQAAEFVGSVAKNTGKELKEAGGIAVGLAVEGGMLAKKGVELVANKAAEKYRLLEERGAQAYENMTSKTKAAWNKFREYRNQKRMEKTDKKYWDKIGSLNTQIAQLEIQRKNLKEGDIKNLGRYSTQIGELEIKKAGVERKYGKGNENEEEQSEVEELKEAA